MIRTALYPSASLNHSRALADHSKAAVTAHIPPMASSATALREIASEQICRKSIKGGR